MRRLAKFIHVLLLACMAYPVWAVPVRFDYAGTNSVLGYDGFLVIDNSVFNGLPFQNLAQAELLDFSMNVLTATGTSFSWGLQDLTLESLWSFDSSGAIPDIVGQEGQISPINELIASGPALIKSSFGTVRNGDWTFAGEWTAVPEPTSLALIVFGLAGVGYGRRRK